MPTQQTQRASIDASLPEAWGSDPLSNFLTESWLRMADAMEIEGERYAALAATDRAFRLLVERLGDSDDPLAATQTVRAHGSLLAAAGLALSGQLAEAYTLMRSVLAAALQGLYLVGDDARRQTWLSRNDGPEAAARAAGEFSSERMRRHLAAIDPTTASIYDRLDARAVEQSVQPNAGWGGAPRRGQAVARPAEEQEYFAAGHEARRFCLRSLVQTGVCALSLLYYAFPDVYRTSGLDAELTQLRQGH